MREIGRMDSLAGLSNRIISPYISLNFCSLPAYSLLWADLRTLSAVQALVLVDYCRLSADVNAFLRTD